MDALLVTINLWQARVHEWGRFDCVLAVADWVLSVKGCDPAADLRFTYGSAGECQRVTGFFTDPLAVVAPRMEACGLAQTDAPLRGDVGLILFAHQDAPRPHGAVAMGPGLWAVVAEAGVMIVDRPKVIACWKVAA